MQRGSFWWKPSLITVRFLVLNSGVESQAFWWLRHMMQCLLLPTRPRTQTKGLEPSSRHPGMPSSRPFPNLNPQNYFIVGDKYGKIQRRKGAFSQRALPLSCFRVPLWPPLFLRGRQHLLPAPAAGGNVIQKGADPKRKREQRTHELEWIYRITNAVLQLQAPAHCLSPGGKRGETSSNMSCIPGHITSRQTCDSQLIWTFLNSPFQPTAQKTAQTYLPAHNSDRALLPEPVSKLTVV